MRTTLRGSIVMLALVVAVAPVAAQPTDNTNQAPAQPTEAPPPPPVPSFTAADVAAAPIPGHESGRLDDIDPQVHKSFSDLQFFMSRHAATGRLFAIAKRGVEDNDVVSHNGFTLKGERKRIYKKPYHPS